MSTVLGTRNLDFCSIYFKCCDGLKRFDAIASGCSLEKFALVLSHRGRDMSRLLQGCDQIFHLMMQASSAAGEAKIARPLDGQD